MAEFTHKSLQEIAVSWLKRPSSGRGPGCQIALQEVGGLYGGERADAWGYRWGWGGGSIVVEVKVSRSDFLADAKKPHRSGEVLGMGTWRYYMCPEGIITLDDLPHGWGLLWVNSRGHVKVMAGHVCCLIWHYWNHPLIWCWSHQVNDQLERDMMAHLLHRVGDPEEANQRIRIASNEASRLAKLVEEHKEEKRKHSYDRLRNWYTEQLLSEAIDMLTALAEGGPMPDTIDRAAFDKIVAHRAELFGGQDPAVARKQIRRERL
jgi:hypothetical protein